MNIILCAINSKFIHSNLAVRSLYENCTNKQHVSVKEFTINNSVDFVLSEIYKMKPDVICFSCYIWNIEFIKKINSSLRKILPSVKIVLGGPEVSFPPFNLNECNGDIICIGEGEKTFDKLVSFFVANKPALHEINGIAYLENGSLRINPTGEIADFNEFAFPYSSLEDFENKIIYYETSRGCPFSCAYCLSSVEEGVRFLNLDRIYSELDFFISEKVKQVKFVDRTFNCNKRHALGIWRYICENDNGYTNFHFEISADLIDDEMLDCLKSARKGLFQLETGVQSTNLNTLEVVSRKTNLGKIYDKVIKIKSFKNIHQHLDLIAGLPGEDYDSFANSFNNVFSLRPEMLQLGFLKLLKGSRLRLEAEKLGIVYRDSAPYEVLFTKEMSFSQMIRLKSIENIIEIYYNSGIFRKSLEYMVSLWEKPFDFFECFADYWEANGYHIVSHQKQKLFIIIYEFGVGLASCNKEILCNLLKFDFFMNENGKNLPLFMEKTDYASIKKSLDRFYSNEHNKAKYFSDYGNLTPKQLSRICHIERFNFDVLNNSLKEKNNQYILFVYEKDVKAYNINLELCQ